MVLDRYDEFRRAMDSIERGDPSYEVEPGAVEDLPFQLADHRAASSKTIAQIASGAVSSIGP